MSTAGSWSVKGIDPKAREIARDLARRSGLTLGEWLNQMIVDTGDEPPPAWEREPEPPPAPTPSAARGWPEPPRRPIAATSSGAPVLDAESFRSRLREAGRGADAGEAGRIARALGDLTARLEAAEHRSTLAISGVDQQAMGVLARLDGVERGAAAVGAQFEGALGEVRDAQARVAERLKRLEGDDARMDAMKALEGALGRVAAQIQDAETRARAQAVETREDVAAVGRRLDKVEARPEVGPVEAALQRLAARVDRLDAAPAPVFDTAPLDAAYARLADRLDDDGRRTSASVRALETAFSDLGARVERTEAAASGPSPHDDALARLAARLDEAQARTGVAVRALETSFAGLDRRLAQAEAADETAAEPAAQDDGAHRLERLAAELHEKVDGARAEMATRLREASDGKLDRMEAAVRDLSDQVAQTEHRSADAIDRMGREVVRIAQGLDGRVGEVERRSEASAAQMGGEMARIADAVETRLSRADGAQAEALEKLGGEIARIAEKLADRIAASERRNAQDLTHGLDEVSEQLQRATDKLNSRHESAAGDLADRIRQSEERTHKLLADARDRAEAQPAASRREPEPDLADTPDPRFSPPVDGAAAPGAAPRREPVGETAFSAGPFEAEADDLDPFGGFADAPTHAAAVAPDPFEGADPFAQDAQPRPAPAVFDRAPDEAAPPRPGSTRQLIEQARAAARASAERNRRPSRSSAPAAAEALFATPAPGFEPGFDEEPAPALRGRFNLPKLRRRETSTAKTALYATGVAVPLTVAAVGAMLMAGEGRGHAPSPVEAPSAAPPLAAASPASAPPILAVAQTAPDPEPVVAAAPVAAAPPAPPEGRVARTRRSRHGGLRPRALQRGGPRAGARRPRRGRGAEARRQPGLRPRPVPPGQALRGRLQRRGQGPRAGAPLDRARRARRRRQGDVQLRPVPRQRRGRGARRQGRGRVVPPGRRRGREGRAVQPGRHDPAGPRRAGERRRRLQMVPDRRRRRRHGRAAGGGGAQAAALRRRPVRRRAQRHRLPRPARRHGRGRAGPHRRELSGGNAGGGRRAPRPWTSPTSC